MTDLALDIQLKATITALPENNGKLAYFLAGVDRYNKLRKETVTPPRILVVLCLHPDSAEWLKWNVEELALRKCAWWVSLRGASSTENSSGQTVYLPISQPFNPDGLREIMTRLSREEDLRYAG